MALWNCPHFHDQMWHNWMRLILLLSFRHPDIWYIWSIHRVFHKLYENANIWHFRLYCVKTKKIQWQNVTPSGNRTQASHSLWFQVQHYPFYTNLTFACKTETLGSLYGHALLIPLNPYKSKCQVVHEQKFNDLLSSTCQVSVERIVLDLESEARPGFYSHWG